MTADWHNPETSLPCVQGKNPVACVRNLLPVCWNKCIVFSFLSLRHLAIQFRSYNVVGKVYRGPVKPVFNHLCKYHNFPTYQWIPMPLSNGPNGAIIVLASTIFYLGSMSYSLLDSLVVECWLRMREVPGSIPIEWPHHTKDVIKMVPVVHLFSTQHWKGKYWLFLKK